ncbi:MAG: sortase B protein-sorting domain-containing protein [Clostridiales bacterium]|nr:sortase B protein-sorting domain-containing protein [Clostridiales bacterium]
MKRVCSLLLAFSLLLSVAQPTALAAELDAADEAAVVAAAESAEASDEEEAVDDAEEEQEEASEAAEEDESEAAEEEIPAAVDEETPAAADETTANEEETSTTADEAADDEEEASTITEDEDDVTVSAAYVDDDSGSLTLELSEGVPADGTYTGAATVEPDEYEDFDAYEVQIAFTFADGALTVAELVSTVDEDNETYFERAFSTGRGKISSIIEQLKGSTTTVDVVSNATCSSKGIVAAYEDAYAQAVAANTSAKEETEYVYAYMNVPYSAFYAELNDSGDVDTVTSATTSKAANCKNVYMTVDSDAGTTSIYGVVVPVKMSAATYEAVAGLVTDSTAAYYVGEDVEDPAVYLELTYEDGAYTFSDIQGTVTTTTVSDTTLSTASVWGDYELDLDADYGIATTEVYGAYVTTTDGAQYAMKQSENLWTPSKYYEAAWDTIDNDYYSSMEGKTIESVTFVTTSGLVVYTLDEPLYVQEHMSSVPTAEFTSATTISISNLAEDAADVSVTVKASGKNGASLTDTAKSIVDGVVTLDAAATDGTTYRVTITSSNYAANIVNATYVAQDYYVLMNIPYDEFYAADVNNDVAVDAFTSATKSKTQTWSLSGGSYHVSEDGSDITGVTFPVKVPKGTDLSAYTQITDDDSLEITVTNRGQTSTTTYAGYKALYQADSYSYYVLSSDPSYYKELIVNEDGSFSFGAVVGESTTVTGSAELTTDTSYGDYQLSVDGITDYVTAGTDDVYGVVLHTEEGSDYGLRHLENIWRVSELAFCTGFTTAVHNCPTSSAHYEAIMGQTITSITYYTSAGIYEVSLSESVYVPTKSEVTVSVEDAYVLDGQTTFTVDGTLADDFDAVYSVDIEGAVIDAENGTITFATDTDLASYTLTITDQDRKYDAITASFSLYNYYSMNVPYSVFYSELNDDGGVDVVTSATTSKAANCKNVYMTVDSDAGTTTIYGVVVPVKVSGSAYSTVKDLVTDAAADYYVGDALESEPTVYLELTYNSRTGYSFSSIQSTAEATTATVDATLSTASVWGDYELDLDSDYGIATTEVYGAYVTTDDGAQYAMKQSENLWTPSKYYEAAWDTIDNSYYASMEGKTITGVTFITTYGIVEYTLSEALCVTPHMADVPAAEFTSGTTLAITGVAEDAENVTVTVKASGKNGTSLTDEAKSIVDGVVTLDTAATDGTAYRVTISSDNYASNIVTAVYSVDTAALTSAIEQANTLAESGYTADSWAAMQTALADATALAEATTGKTQAEVDKITAALTAAIDSLVDITALTAAIETAQALTESSYTADSWAAMQSALTAAQTVAADSDATQTQVDEATSALTATVAALVDTSALTAAVAKAEALTESSYTASTWSALQTALTDAKAVAANSSATQAQVDEAAAAVTSAISALVSADTQKKLETTVYQVSTLTQSGYTTESWDALQTALAAANAVLNNPDASQSEVESAIAALTSAVDALVAVDEGDENTSTSSGGSSTDSSTSSDSSTGSSTSSDGSSSSSSTSSDGSSSSSSTSSDNSSSSSSTSSDDSSTGSSSSSSTSSPKTGDASQMMLWVILLAGSATGLVINFHRKRTDNAE